MCMSRYLIDFYIARIKYIPQKIYSNIYHKNNQLNYAVEHVYLTMI